MTKLKALTSTDRNLMRSVVVYRSKMQASSDIEWQRHYVDELTFIVVFIRSTNSFVRLLEHSTRIWSYQDII